MPQPIGYIDPGSGSLLLQLLVGGVATVGVTARFYGRRLLRALGFGKRAEGDR